MKRTLPKRPLEQTEIHFSNNSSHIHINIHLSTHFHYASIDESLNFDCIHLVCMLYSRKNPLLDDVFIWGSELISGCQTYGPLRRSGQVTNSQNVGKTCKARGSHPGLKTQKRHTSFVFYPCRQTSYF